MVKRYRVTLPIDVDGKVYEFGAVVELDDETARVYQHALIRKENGPVAPEGEEDGGNS